MGAPLFEYAAHRHRLLTNALLAFNQGRADTLMWDDSVLVGIATADRSSKLTNDVFIEGRTGRDPAQGTRR